MGLEYTEWNGIWSERDSIIGEHTMYPQKIALGSPGTTAYDQFKIIECYADSNMTFIDWVNSTYNYEVLVNGIQYEGVTSPYYEGGTDRTKFTNNIKRSKWVYTNGMINSVEDVLLMYPNYNMDGDWDYTFYSGIEKVNIAIVAKVDWDSSYSNLKNIMQNLPYRNQDRRDTYVTSTWGYVGAPQNGENIDYTVPIVNNGIYLCQSFPVYDGGDGI